MSAILESGIPSFRAMTESDLDQSEKEIGTKTPGVHLGFQVTVGGCYQSEVRSQGFGSADTFESKRDMPVDAVTSHLRELPRRPLTLR